MTGITHIMHSLIASLAIAAVVFAAPGKVQQSKPQNSLCADGWTRFEDSCYFHERNDQLPFRLAEKQCQELKSTLFVANTEEEYNAVIMSAPLNSFTWVGMKKDGETKTVGWDTDDSMDFQKIDWLNKPYGDAVNGWTTVTQCAAHWNPSTEVGKYAFFYPCGLSFHYICERNMTLPAL